MIDNHIIMVLPYNVMNVWPQAEPVLLPAIKRGMTHSPDDVRHAILAGNAQLWVKWSSHVQAAMVTEFKQYPQGLWFNVWLYGAIPDYPQDETEFEPPIFEFADKNNCTGIMHTGRKGWEKRHQHLPGTISSIVYQLLLKDLKRVA